MHVFLTGATGFVGTYVLKELLGAGHTVRCLLRNVETPLKTGGKLVEKVQGDITDPKSLTGLLRGCDAVIHLVGIIKEKPNEGITFNSVHYEATTFLVEEALASDVGCFIQMSANGVRRDGVSAYQTSKWKAEKYVKEAGFRHWTVFRPSVIFGKPVPGQPEFATQLVESLILPFPILPVFGDGTYEMQPVAIEDVARAFVQSLTRPAAHGQTYPAAGPIAYPYTKILNILAEAVGITPKPQIKQPIWLVRPIIHAVGKFDLLPITPDQFEMLIEGNTCDPTAFYRDFDLERIPFTPENLAYLREEKSTES